MNKTLIAMAVAGLMAAPMAAQADATIYGKLHTSIDFGDNGGSDLPPLNASGVFWQDNSSRLGFKGSEDLGGGLKAIWQIENSVGVGSGNQAWASRNTFVGLQGGWGTLLGGKHDTPFKTTGRKFDLFGDMVGDSRNLIQLNNYDFADNWDRRPDNAVMYKTPVFGGGWDITAMYVLDEGIDDNTILSANVNWKTGNWFTSLAYESHDANKNLGPDSSSGIRLGVKWTPAAWMLTAFYQTISDIQGVNGVDGDAYGIGAGYKMGKNVLKAQYYMTSNDLAGNTDNVDATLLALAWDYNFSKRTTGYVAYSMTDNDGTVYYGTDTGGHGGEIYDSVTTATLKGDDPSALSFGVIHKF